MTAILEPIITTANFLSIPDALDWYQKNIHPDTNQRDIEITIEEGGIEIGQPKPKARYNLTAPHGRWQYELDEYWKNLAVMKCSIINRDTANMRQGLHGMIVPLVDGGETKIKPELLQSAWYDYVEPMGKEVALDYKQYIYVEVLYHDEITWQLDFYKDEECDGSSICIHSAYTNSEKTQILQAKIELDYR